MAYKEELAERIRGFLGGQSNVEEKRMFGGLAFMINGHMACGIEKDRLMVRVAKDRHAEFLARPHAGEMDLTGRPMRGFLFIQPSGYEKDADLAFWIEQARAFALCQPRKALKKRSPQSKDRRSS
jgi:TfoX-like protein